MKVVPLTLFSGDESCTGTVVCRVLHETQTFLQTKYGDFDAKMRLPFTITNANSIPSLETISTGHPEKLANPQPTSTKIRAVVNPLVKDIKPQQDLVVICTKKGHRCHSWKMIEPPQTRQNMIHVGHYTSSWPSQTNKHSAPHPLWSTIKVSSWEKYIKCWPKILLLLCKKIWRETTQQYIIAQVSFFGCNPNPNPNPSPNPNPGLFAEPERIFCQVKRRYARSIHLAFVFWQRFLSHDFRPIKNIRYIRPIKRKNRSKSGQMKQSATRFWNANERNFSSAALFCKYKVTRIRVRVRVRVRARVKG